jgi:hypothetical protein
MTRITRDEMRAAFLALLLGGIAAALGMGLIGG